MWAEQCRGFASPCTIVGGPTIDDGAGTGPAVALNYTRFIDNFVTWCEGASGPALATPELSDPTVSIAPVVSSVADSLAGAGTSVPVAPVVPVAPGVSCVADSLAGAGSAVPVAPVAPVVAPIGPVAPGVSLTATSVPSVSVTTAPVIAAFTANTLVVDLGVWCGRAASDSSWTVSIAVQPFPTAQPVAPVHSFAKGAFALLTANPAGTKVRWSARPLTESPDSLLPVSHVFMDTLAARSTKHPNAATLRDTLAAKLQHGSPFWLGSYPPVGDVVKGTVDVQRSSVNFGSHIDIRALVAKLTTIVGGSVDYQTLVDALNLQGVVDLDSKTLWLKHLINFFTLGLLPFVVAQCKLNIPALTLTFSLQFFFCYRWHFGGRRGQAYKTF